MIATDPDHGNKGIGKALLNSWHGRIKAGTQADNEPARKAFKQNEWNKVRVEALGDSIKTWLNGVPAADLKDSMTPSGFIGLQVHGVGKRTEPLRVRWRNLRIKEVKEFNVAK